MPIFVDHPFFRMRCIPEGRTVDGDLDLRGASTLQQIGDGLKVMGSFWLGGIRPRDIIRAGKDGDSEVAGPRGGGARRGSVPSSKTAPEAPRSGQCQIAELPERLVVDQDFHLQSCARVTQLPRSMRVGGSLTLCGLPRLREFPAGVLQGRRLSITGCPQLAQLPAGWNALELLIIDGAGIRALPEDLQMTPGAQLILQNCAHLQELPAALVGSGLLSRIVIRNCPKLESLPDLVASGQIIIERLRMVKAGSRLQASRVRVSRCSQLSVVTGHTEAKDLTVSYCHALVSIPTPADALTSLNLWGCDHLAELPSNLRFRSVDRMALLNLTGCAALAGLPPDITVEGKWNGPVLGVEMTGSGLRSAPEYGFDWRVRIRGAWLDPRFVFHSDAATPAEILTHRNSEVRRVLLERVGIGNLLARTEHAIVDEDSDAGGPRRLIRVKLPPIIPPRMRGFFTVTETPTVALGRTIMRLLLAPFRPRPRATPSPVATKPAPGPPELNAAFLHCRCPTTAREYLLPVPSAIFTCRAAAAWMAGFDNPDDYRPELET